jgi:rare lipoprotein A
MSFIGRAGNSCGDIAASRVLPDAPLASSDRFRNSARLVGVALSAVTLAACAQSPVATTKSDLRVSQQALPEDNQEAQAVPEKRVAVRAKKHTPFRTDKPAAGTQTASQGIASFYSEIQPTANGETFNPNELTAAHRTLPFGTRLRVTNVATGKSVTVRINDRGPFIAGRVVDVSYSAAETLGIVSRGVAKVKLDVVQ